MYEILILGELLEEDKSGYVLGMILNHILGPGRKISNGTLHPILVKLVNCGDIEWIVDTRDPRGTKMAHITEQGAAHFQELMKEPVKDNARRDDIYRFKIAGLQQTDKETQISVLRDFRNVTQAKVDYFSKIIEHVSLLPDKPATNINWTVQTIDLDISLATTNLNWIDQQLNELSEK